MRGANGRHPEQRRGAADRPQGAHAERTASSAAIATRFLQSAVHEAPLRRRSAVSNGNRNTRVWRRSEAAQPTSRPRAGPGGHAEEAVAAQQRIDDLPCRDQQQCQSARLQARALQRSCPWMSRAGCVTQSLRNPRFRVSVSGSLPATGSFTTISSTPGLRTRFRPRGEQPQDSLGVPEQSVARTQLIASPHAPPSRAGGSCSSTRWSAGSTTRGSAARRFRSVRRAACRPRDRQHRQCCSRVRRVTFPDVDRRPVVRGSGPRLVVDELPESALPGTSLFPASGWRTKSATSADPPTPSLQGGR